MKMVAVMMMKMTLIYYQMIKMMVMIMMHLMRIMLRMMMRMVMMMITMTFPDKCRFGDWGEWGLCVKGNQQRIRKVIDVLS